MHRLVRRDVPSEAQPAAASVLEPHPLGPAPLVAEKQRLETEGARSSRPAWRSLIGRRPARAPFRRGRLRWRPVALPARRAAAQWSLCPRDCPCAGPSPPVERSALSDTPRPPQDSRYRYGLDPHSLDRHPKPPDPRRNRNRRVPMQSGLSLRRSGRHRRLSDPRRPRRDLRRSHGAHRTGLPCACWPCASCCRTNSPYRPLTVADGGGVGLEAAPSAPRPLGRCQSYAHVRESAP